MKKTTLTAAVVTTLLFANGIANAKDTISEAAQKGPVLLVGDSMMKAPGNSLGRIFRKDKISFKNEASLGSGLARLDAYDWFGKLEEFKTALNPNLVIIMMGANDKQPMKSDTAILQPDTPEWDTEYAARIGKMMDIASNNGTTEVIWIKLPPMKDEAMNKHAEAVNAILDKEVKTRSNVVLYDPMPELTPRTPKEYKKVIMSSTGTPIEIRSDEVHLSPQGANILAQNMMKKFWNKK